MFPGETSKQDRDLAAFFSSKRALYRAVEMIALVETGNLSQPHPLRFQALLDFFVFLNLNEIRRHYLPPAGSVSNVRCDIGKK